MEPGTSRGIGELEVIQQLLPEWLAVVFALLTQLGDIWFLALVFALLYWYNTPNHDDIAALAGVWLAGMGLVMGLKEVFGFPRPDRPLLDPDLLPWFVRPVYETTAFASGYGFPSGHAVNTTIVFVGLAYVLPVGTPRKRYVAAGVLVATVSFTRLALGVHFLVDVVAGVVVGLSVLVGARALVNLRLAEQTTVSFGLAVACGWFFLVASEVDPDAIFVLGASLGAFGGWQLVVLGRELVSVSRPSLAVRPILVRGGLAALAFAPLNAALDYFPVLSVYSTGGAVGFVAAGITVVPVLHHSERARRAGVAVEFWLRMAGVAVRYLLTPEPWRRAVEFVSSSSVADWVRSR
ncbi:phosphoesterase PA-phosphatase [Halobacteriales archaeon QS_8_69_26]|nr:MAG: phosphoesterase PA-phosphatase [Halobacteriales archaeon QS_8_69_26]